MSFYSSRSQAQPNVNDEQYTTIELYFNSQIGTIPLAGYSNINAGFTVQLANPIILDIDHRYVIALIKKSFDISQYTTKNFTFDINCDIIEYQYENNQKTQLLYQSYDHEFDPASPIYSNPSIGDIIQINYKFINPTQKIISRMSFWITDAETGQPLLTPLPPNFSYPTKLCVLLKKVNTHVIAVSAI
jgi:hypothetical protein